MHSDVKKTLHFLQLFFMALFCFFEGFRKSAFEISGAQLQATLSHLGHCIRYVNCR